MFPRKGTEMCMHSKPNGGGQKQQRFYPERHIGVEQGRVLACQSHQLIPNPIGT